MQLHDWPAALDFLGLLPMSTGANKRPTPTRAHSNMYRSFFMNTRTTIAAALTALALLSASGCAVTRGQQTVGAYIDDATITTTIKARFVDSKAVDASSISIETLNGTVMLSGFAKSASERDTAERIARGVNGVKAVKNQIVIQP